MRSLSEVSSGIEKAIKDVQDKEKKLYECENNLKEAVVKHTEAVAITNELRKEFESILNTMLPSGMPQGRVRTVA